MEAAVIELLTLLLSQVGDYIINYIIDEAGDKIIEIFTDEDGDGEADTPDEPIFTLPFSEVEEKSTTSIIVVSPDGTLTIYDESGNISEDMCDTAYSLWVSENGIMDKKLDNYSVTEGLLFLLLMVSVAYFIRGLFRRKDMFR